MESIIEFTKGATGVLALCGVLFLGMEAIDGSLSPPRQQAIAAQMVPPSKNVAPLTPVADYFPARYTNQAKEIEELPAQF